MKLVLLAAALGCVGTTFAYGQSDEIRGQLAAVVGTLSVQATPQMSDGALTGCLLTFEAMQQDYTYLKGNFVRVSGSVGFMGSDGVVGLVVKVVAMELDPTLPRLGGAMLEPTRAYLVASDLSTNYASLVQAHPGENGGIFAIYQLDPGTATILEGMVTNNITVAFSLGDGSMDIQMPIEIDVIDVLQDGTRTRSSNTTTNFTSCVELLFSQ